MKKIGWLIVFYLITTGGYLYFSHQPTDFHFLTALDKSVPTIPVFILPYLFATFLFLALPIYLLFFVKKEIFYGYTLTQVIASILSYLVFWFFPTSVVREPITQTGFFAESLRQIHSVDRPSAAFPSGHVFSSVIIGYFLWVYYPKTRLYVAIILPMIIVSTVLLKQHYLPDIPGGILLAVLAIIVSEYLIQSKLLPFYLKTNR
jgi:membrane-associated phospholipid phosphatase